MTQGPIVNNIVYKDFDILFDKHPVTRKLNTLTNNAAIARSIKNLILTNKGERPYQPFLGCDVRSQLFELNNGTLESELEDAIEECIKFYEPRAELMHAFVDANIDGNAITVEIKFRAINQQDPVTISIPLERVR